MQNPPNLSVDPRSERMRFAPRPLEARSGSVVAIAALVAGAIGLVAWLIMFFAAWRSVPVDKVVLHYTGGPIEGEHFERVVSPGSGTRFYGLLDSVHELPATQRNYIMSKHPRRGRHPSRRVRRGAVVGQGGNRVGERHLL